MAVFLALTIFHSPIHQKTQWLRGEFTHKTVFSSSSKIPTFISSFNLGDCLVESESRILRNRNPGGSTTRQQQQLVLLFFLWDVFHLQYTDIMAFFVSDSHRACTHDLDHRAFECCY